MGQWCGGKDQILHLARWWQALCRSGLLQLVAEQHTVLQEAREAAGHVGQDGGYEEAKTSITVGDAACAAKEGDAGRAARTCGRHVGTLHPVPAEQKGFLGLLGRPLGMRTAPPHLYLCDCTLTYAMHCVK